MAQRNPKPALGGGRICDICGQRYLRANLIRSWPTHNPGHVAGWQRIIQKICTKCMTAQQSGRLLRIATVTLITPSARQGKLIPLRRK